MASREVTKVTASWGGVALPDNLTKFIWVKNYTKTYKNRKNDCNIRKIRINTRVNRTEKIHEKEGKKSAKIYSDRGSLYK